MNVEIGIWVKEKGALQSTSKIYVAQLKNATTNF